MVLSVRYTPQPEKNEASHYQDALQYAALLIQKGIDYTDDELSDVARKLSESRNVLRRII